MFCPNLKLIFVCMQVCDNLIFTVYLDRLLIIVFIAYACSISSTLCVEYVCIAYKVLYMHLSDVFYLIILHLK